MNETDSAACPQASDAILARIGKLHPRSIDLSLGRIRRLLARLGHPEKNLPPVLHVAGTNGKGSVSAYWRAILEAQGLATHAYTSPHLVKFHERIYLGKTTGGANISEEKLVEVLETCERINDGAAITFFEITTAAALLAFAENPAQACILETGMGGRYDTTNVVETPAVTALTPVSLDHQGFLGTTVAEIAETKAGIMRPDVPVIIGPQQDGIDTLLLAQAEHVEARPFLYGRDWMSYQEHGRLVYQDTEGLLDLPLPRLIGQHQLVNAGIAVAALRCQQELDITESAISKGLQQVYWPARMQRLKEGPLLQALPEDTEIWLDGGHNQAAGLALARTFADMNDRADRPLYLVLGMMHNKDARTFLAAFTDLAHQVLAVPIEGEEAHPPEMLAEAARQTGLKAQAAQSLPGAFTRLAKTCLNDKVSPRILVCGSLYLAGQVLAQHR